MLLHHSGAEYFTRLGFLRSGLRILTSVCFALTVLAPSITPAAEAGPIVKLGSKPSEVLITKITVSDLKSSLAFYTRVLGLKEVHISGLTRPDLDDPNLESAEIPLNFSGSPADPMICLVKSKGVAPSREQASLTWVVLKTANMSPILERYRAAGLPIKLEPIKPMGMVISLINDPDGYIVQLLEAQAVKR